jgi:hypothetical protein
VTKWSLNWREWTPESTCPEYDKLKPVAEELLTSLTGATSPEQFVEAQQSLLFYWQELEQRKDPLHPRFPGGHRCLEHCYLEYAMRIRGKALLFQPPQPPEAPPAPPAPRSEPLSDEELMERLKDYVAERAKETFFGQDQEVEEREEEES